MTGGQVCMREHQEASRVHSSALVLLVPPSKGPSDSLEQRSAPLSEGTWNHTD